MATSVVILPNTDDAIDKVGDPVQANGWYGFSDGTHTVSIHTVNFTGRVYIQASLAMEPTEDDWFDIWLTDETPYVQFPLNPSHPTGNLQGDTTNIASVFRANVLWIRAKVIRSEYLNIPQPYYGSYGVVSKIVLGM